MFGLATVTVYGTRKPLMKRITTFINDSDGATAVEYAVMLALIIATILTTIGAVGAQTGGMWGGISSDLTSAGVGS